MSYVDYAEILNIIKNCADENKSAREVYNLVVFAYGSPKEKT